MGSCENEYSGFPVYGGEPLSLIDNTHLMPIKINRTLDVFTSIT